MRVGKEMFGRGGAILLGEVRAQCKNWCKKRFTSRKQMEIKQHTV